MVRSAAGGWNEDQLDTKQGTGLSFESCVVCFVFFTPSFVFAVAIRRYIADGGDDSPVNANGTYPR